MPAALAAQPRTAADDGDDVGSRLDLLDRGVLEAGHQASRSAYVERVAVGHAGDVRGDRRRVVAPVGEVVEDRPDHIACAAMLHTGVLPQVDAVEHERAERRHRVAHLVALADVALAGRGLHQVVYEPVDPRTARWAEQLELVSRQVAGRQDPVADRIVDVVVDVGDAVDDADDAALQRRGLLRPRVGEDSVRDLVREVELPRDLGRPLVVAEASAEPLA